MGNGPKMGPFAVSPKMSYVGLMGAYSEVLITYEGPINNYKHQNKSDIQVITIMKGGGNNSTCRNRIGSVGMTSFLYVQQAMSIPYFGSIIIAKCWFFTCVRNRTTLDW